ncbi:hypothetical protein [Nocardiopsis tropica]|uniref:Uncharacterized protein n=1 Tax=Nocardiopsis tropica TaxID=109330 RepID=A0ABU7KNN8_9ACTN|nr:hypothetical protein [Nocardiopsis umidischolae]MEE2050292.1 hypothetical protein [Nocardiopsis umidischolae]
MPTYPAEDPHISLAEAIEQKKAEEAAERIRAKIAESKARQAEKAKKKDT